MKTNLFLVLFYCLLAVGSHINALLNSNLKWHVFAFFAKQVPL